MGNYVELPLGQGSDGAALALHCPLGAAVADSFAWLAHPGVLSGRLSLEGGDHVGAHTRNHGPHREFQ